MMEDLLALFEANLGATIENIVLLLTTLGSMLFLAKDLRLGIIILFIFFAMEFVIFSTLGMETFFTLMAFLSTFVVMSLTLYVSRYKTGGAIV